MTRLRRAVAAILLASAVGCTQIGTAMRSAIEESVADSRPAGTVREDVFFSEALGVRKHVAVYLPPSDSRDTTRRFPVAYYLHGLSGTETDWLSKGSIDVVADSLFARGTPEMIIVMPDM